MNRTDRFVARMIKACGEAGMHRQMLDKLLKSLAQPVGTILRAETLLIKAEAGAKVQIRIASAKSKLMVIYDNGDLPPETEICITLLVNKWVRPT